MFVDIVTLTLLKTIGASGKVNIMAEFPIMEVTDEPSILVADTYAYIVAPQTRLNVD